MNKYTKLRKSLGYKVKKYVKDYTTIKHKNGTQTILNSPSSLRAKYQKAKRGTNV